MLLFVLFILPFAAAESPPDYYNPYAPIFTDQPAYSWTDKVHITIVAPSWNSDAHLIDSIGGSPEHAVKVSTRGFSLDRYRLTETDVNTGIFTGEVILTGFLHDADGDGGPDTNPRTAGRGPTGGFLETEAGSALTISFEFARGVVVTESVPIRWSVGTVEFATVSERGATVRIADPDMNLNPEAVDRVLVTVNSDSDAAGLLVGAAETRPDSGVFEADVLFARDGKSSGNRLHAAPGGTVYAVYEDRTLPAPYGTSDELPIGAQARLASDAPPAERAKIHGVSIRDGLGSPVDAPATGQQVQVVGGLTSNQQVKQPFTYLIQIRDADGLVVKLSWLSGVLQPGDTLDASLSWTPEAPGRYAIESFVWESVRSMSPVSEPHTVRVLVE